MNLPNVTSADIPAILDREDIEIRAKDDPVWYHAPIIWIQIAIVALSGRSPTAFSLTLPLFWGGASVYLSEKYDVEAIRRGGAPDSSMPLVVHELTHAFQIIELGAIAFGFYYVTFPLPVYWTSRSSIEWEADANEILWLRRRYSYGTESWLDQLIESSSEIFTSATYVWPTTDSEGWKRSLKRFLGTSRMVDQMDARDDEFNSLFSLFGGYNFRGATK